MPTVTQLEIFWLLKKVFETGASVLGKEARASISTVAEAPLENRYYDFTCQRITAPDGEPYGVYKHAVDATDRVRARLTLEQSKRDLKSAFLANISHEI